MQNNHIIIIVPFCQQYIHKMLRRLAVGVINRFVHNIPDVVYRYDMIACLHIFNAGMKGQPSQLIDCVFMHFCVLTAIGYKRTVIQRFDVKSRIKEGLHFRIGGNQFLYISLRIYQNYQDACPLLVQSIQKASHAFIGDVLCRVYDKGASCQLFNQFRRILFAEGISVYFCKLSGEIMILCPEVPDNILRQAHRV